MIFHYFYVKIHRYEKTNEEDKIQNKKNVSFSKTNEKTLDGFEQDPFAEAFNASTPDPFGNAFSSPNITVRFFNLNNYIYKLYNK